MAHKSSLQTALIEVVSIVVAVIMGFVVNEWRENRGNQRKARTAFERITQEAEENHAQLQDRQDYYRRMIAVIDSLAKTSRQIHSYAEIPGWSGINPPMLSASSYKTAASIGVFSYMDFQTADQISKLYMIQEDLSNLRTTTIQALVTGELYREGSIRMMFVVYSELIEGWFGAYRRLTEQSG